MPFLARNAVVRESPAKAALVPTGVTIVVGRDAPGPRQSFENLQIREAAKTLSSFLQKITGHEVPVAQSLAAAPAGSPKIWVGAAANPLAEFPELKTADAHGFLISRKAGENGEAILRIVGASGTGTMNGVWFFLMNYAGVRQVLPGGLGEIVPQAPGLEIPRELYVLNPAPDFLLRIWSGGAGLNSACWLADTGTTERFQYHHNGHNIYPPEKLGAEHPEYFPVKAGKPWIPLGQTDGWQPSFSHPASVIRALEYADELFRTRPDLKSLSVTVNDGLGYSEDDMKLGQLLPDGSASIAEPYGRFVNAVADGLHERWPDKYVAFLPYNLTKHAPSFPLAQNVIVFLFKEPKQSFQEWDGKAQHVGLYLWLYGFGYVLPNHWPHALQEGLQWTRAHGGVAFKGEAYPAWMHDGPKLWVLSNLLWNTDANVDALLRDYFEHTYGPEAAPAVARYFAQAEKIYERRRTPDEFRYTYLRPGENQFEHVTAEDMAAMRAALEEARRVVVGDANKQRLELLARTFRWAELYWQQYAVQERLLTAQVHSENEAQDLLAGFGEFEKLGAAAREHFEKQIKTAPALCVYSTAPDRLDASRADPQFKWARLDEAKAAACTAVSRWLTLDQKLSAGDAASWWERIAGNRRELKPYAESQRLALLHPGAPLKNYLSNGSFEEPPGAATGDPPDVAKDWPIYQNRMVNAQVFLDRDVHHDGGVSLTARGMTDYSGVHRYVSAPNHARYRLSYWYRTTPETQHIQTVVFLSQPLTVQLPPAGEWTHAEEIFLMDKPGGAETTFAINLGLRHGGSEKSQAWFDDVRLELLAPAGAE